MSELADVVQTAWAEELPLRILGGGANVLVADEGVPGLVIINHVSKISFGSDDRVVAESGTGLGILARKCQGRGLAGMEWAVSVPGTVGGAVVNNAGAHGGDMGGVVEEVEVLEAEGGLRTYSRSDLDYDYRYSCLKARQDRRFLVLRAILALKSEDAAQIAARMEHFTAYRKQTQPPGASLGSIFKNPPGDYAGRLIEAAGLKGYRIGGAQVSPVHANFFVNSGQASAQDYYRLIRHVQQVVEAETGISLTLEIELIGGQVSGFDV
jgi:UDP-N-acetylmuramate dehydrogenase